MATEKARGRRSLTVANPSALPMAADMPPAFGAATPEQRQDALLNRGKVLAAAQSLFAQHGVAAVTMTDIAREAGVGKGTLYRRFPDKANLCLALLDERTRLFQDSVLAELRNGGPRADALAQLRLFMARMVTFTESNAALLEPISATHLDDAQGGYFDRPVYRWMRLTVLVLLRDGTARGVVRPGLDLEYMADALLAPLHIDLYLYHRRCGFSPGRIAAGLGYLLDGIAAQQV